MAKKWVLKKQGEDTDVNHLTDVLGIEKPLANLMVQRGIKTYDQAKQFFRPGLTDLYDPFLMKDMNRAIDRINMAIVRNENILVYGDYDVDGTTSVALVYSFFKEYYPSLGYYIPDRYEEGYGISYKGIDYAKENNYSLIISLDCGIKAVEKISYAKKINIDFIVCDHHNPGEELPDATAILDPKQPGCNYPYKHLSGCGVGFKLIHAYSIINNIPFENITHYLDLVAVSVASDIVPIVDENRVLTYFGLQQLNTAPRKGLESIIKIAGLDNCNITVEDIVFKIGPRINAAGRIESGMKSVELLITDNVGFAKSIGDKINHFNDERRKIDYQITQEALQMIAGENQFEERTATVLYNPNWHKGVIGIVASRLIDTYYRPTVILTQSNGLITGSARSVSGFDLYSAVEKCSDLLENFGGHMYAAGLTMKIENIELFKKRFEEVVSETISKEQMVPVIEVDGLLGLHHITPKLIRILKQFEPFGPGNISPIFQSSEVIDIGTGKIVGSTRQHMKLEIAPKNDRSPIIPAIAFQLSEHFKGIKSQPFDICYHIEENHFRGNTSIQLNIKDIRFNSNDGT